MPHTPPGLIEVYDALISEAESGSFHNFYTLHNTLWKVDRAYVDNASHYSDLGCKIIAERIAEIIAPAWKK